jgi:hypothetical protein
MGRETDAAADDMYDALVQMRHTLGKDRKAFVRAYAEFGRAMSENQFAFRTALAFVGDGVRIHYRIEGERISLYEQDYVTEGGKIKLVDRSTIKPSEVSSKVL